MSRPDKAKKAEFPSPTRTFESRPRAGMTKWGPGSRPPADVVLTVHPDSGRVLRTSRTGE